MGGGGGGSSAAKLDKFSRLMNKERYNQELAFNPYREQARSLFGSILDPYAGMGSQLSGFKYDVAPTAGSPAVAPTPFRSAFDQAVEAFLGSGRRFRDYGKTPTGTGGTGPQLLYAPTAGATGASLGGAASVLPESLTARDQRRLGKFVRRSARKGTTFEDIAATEGSPAIPASAGVLSQNPADVGMRAIYDKISGLSDLRFSNPEQAFAASQLAKMTDTGSLTDAANQTVEKIIGPQLLAQLTASGLGRSGAVAEGLSNAGAQLALPIAQMGYNAQGNLANFIAQLGQNRSNLISNIANPATGGSPHSVAAGTTSAGGGGSNAAGIIGGLGTAATGIGALYSSGALGALASLLPFSSRRFKENILPITEEGVMNDLRKTPIYTWNYKGDKKRKIGTITEEAPEMLTAHNRLMLDPVSYFGMLHVGLKNIDKRLNRMEAYA